jgi:rhodanese-related sulfurtransferase
MVPTSDENTELEPERVAEALAEGWQVIDVREPYEWQAGHIAGTRHVELSRLAAEASTLDRERPVIFTCRVGNRSAMATDAFRASGLRAYNLRGGITEWVRRGLPIEPADGHVAAH